MTKSKVKSDHDLIQLHWSTIFFGLCDRTMRRGMKDFEILELDQSPDPVQRTAFVHFSGETSKEAAIEMLQQIIETIEKNGVPETTRKVPRRYGARVMQLQEHG